MPRKNPNLFRIPAMAHLPLHGLQTKAQRLQSIAHEVSVSGAHTAWTYRFSETIQPLLRNRISRFRFPNQSDPNLLDPRPARPGQV
jgi:hypothetical protein